MTVGFQNSSYMVVDRVPKEQSLTTSAILFMIEHSCFGLLSITS
jgi:hypothetical protein